MIGSRRYLLDTNVISETRRRRPEPKVERFLRNASDSQLFLSALTIGELRRGVEAKRRTEPVAAAALDGWLTELASAYADRVLSVDAAVTNQWGLITADRPRPVIDTLLAATALVHGLVLVTRDIRDVGDTGVQLLNPWRAGP